MTDNINETEIIERLNSAPSVRGLGDLSVRLKLLFGLGVLSDDIYHDIEDIIKLKNQLNSDASDYEFTDSNILEPIKKLNLVKNMGMGLSLAIVDICNELGKESPF